MLRFYGTLWSVIPDVLPFDFLSNAKEILDAQKIGNSDTFEKLTKQINNLETFKDKYVPFENGMAMLGTIGGGLISSDFVAPVLRNKYASIKQKQEIDEADIDWLLNDFKDEVRGNISGLTTNVTILVENYDNISEAAVTSATVRNMITMMTQGDLSVLTERINMIEQSATTHQHEYQNLYEQTMRFLDPNVDQLIQRVKDINTVVSGNTNDIENIKRQLSGV